MFRKPVHRGIGGMIQDLGNYLFGHATQRVKNFLKEHGEEEITSISLGRTPIQSGINTAMKLITLGKFDSVKKNYGYDAYYHLFLIVNGKYKMEKNETVNIVPYTKQADEVNIEVPLKGKTMTINEFIKAGEKRMGEMNYWENYSATSANCQGWVWNNLSANDIFNEDIRKFTYQDTEKLIEAIPPKVLDAVNETTKGASFLNKMISWLSNGKWNLRKGGKVRKFI